MQEKGAEQLWEKGDRVRILEQGQPGSERAAFTHFGGKAATVTDPRPDHFSGLIDGFPASRRAGQEQGEAPAGTGRRNTRRLSARWGSTAWRSPRPPQALVRLPQRSGTGRYSAMSGSAFAQR